MEGQTFNEFRMKIVVIFVGWEELKFTAIRYQRKFPHILERTYDRSKFLFRHTRTQRTEASFKAFVEGEKVLTVWFHSAVIRISILNRTFWTKCP